MKTILNILDERKPRLIWLLSILTIIVICLAIIFLENIVDIRPLSVIPVLLASWYGGVKTGTAIAIISAISLFITNYTLASFHINNSSALYDSIIALAAYIFISTIVTNFRKVHSVEVVAADTDTLTGVSSSRKFYSELENEILRSRRYGHTLSLAYIDIDNFKIINDTLGHPVGDELLVQLSKSLLMSLRATDIVARLGGDEFVCLLPETEQDEAKLAILKAEKALKNTIKVHNWNVSFSIGVVTFDTVPHDSAQAVKLADDLMYQVKGGNKNDIAYRVWRGVA
jgi:diguanylate cyclase (GGDEF)-like protein